VSFLSELKRRNVLRVGAAYIVTAWLVVQVVETLFPIYGLSDGVVRLVVNVLAVGLVPVLVLAWVFEWTPDGLKREDELDSHTPASLQAAKRLDRMILVVLALALGYFAFDRFVLVPRQVAEQVKEARQEGRTEALVESYGDQSIAVLAFEDMSPDGDQEYLSDGIAEEILNLLAQIPELRVISRSSAFTYKGRNVAVPQIAKELNVSHVLEGSVRKAGDHIRITAQLIDARSDTHLWSETYDRTLIDVFAIQDELAAATVEQLQLRLLGEIPHAMSADPEAYDLYLRGKHFLNIGQAAKASELLVQAVEIAPDFVPAWADLTTSYVFSAPTMGRNDHTGDPVFSKLVATSARLAELAPGHPLVLTYGAWQTIEMTGDYRAGAEMLSTAVEQNPNDHEVLRSASYIASLLGRKDLAVRLATRLVRVNPLCTRCLMHHYRMLMHAERFGDAVDAVGRLIELQPDRGFSVDAGVAHLMNGETDLARELFENHPSQDIREWGLLLLRASGAGQAVNRGELEELEESFAGGTQMIMAEAYAMAGYPDDAFRLLRRESERTANWRFGHLLGSPLIKSLRGLGSWNEMLETAGLAPAQLSGINFDPVLKWE